MVDDDDIDTKVDSLGDFDPEDDDPDWDIYFRFGDGFVLVFSITEYKSFSAIPEIRYVLCVDGFFLGTC